MILPIFVGLLNEEFEQKAYFIEFLVMHNWLIILNF